MRYLFGFFFLLLVLVGYSRPELSVCFTPKQDCTRRIVNLIRSAKSSVYVQAYSFTSRDIANALIAAKRRGVSVELIADKSQFQCQNFSSVRVLLQKGVPVWADVQPVVAHNKVIIVDKKIVETGSFNYTYSAEHRNAENVLIVSNEALAKLYLKNWDERKQVSLSVARVGCAQRVRDRDQIK